MNLLGYAMIAAPFVLVAVIAGKTVGWYETIGIFLGTAVLVAWCLVAAKLVAT